MQTACSSERSASQIRWEDTNRPRFEPRSSRVARLGFSSCGYGRPIAFGSAGGGQARTRRRFDPEPEQGSTPTRRRLDISQRVGVRRITTSIGVVAAMLTGLLALLPPPAGAVSPDVVISQVYGGGGNSGATYTTTSSSCSTAAPPRRTSADGRCSTRARPGPGTSPPTRFRPDRHASPPGSTSWFNSAPVHSVGPSRRRTPRRHRHVGHRGKVIVAAPPPDSRATGARPAVLPANSP